MKKLRPWEGKSPSLGTQIYIQFWVCGSSKTRLSPRHCVLASTEGLAEVGEDPGDAGRVGLRGSQCGSGDGRRAAGPAGSHSPEQIQRSQHLFPSLDAWPLYFLLVGARL